VAARFDAVLLDAGGVLVLPDPAVLGPLLAYYGGSVEPTDHHRAHYTGMKAKSDAGALETEWAEYNAAYVYTVGVTHGLAEEAGEVLGRTRSAWLWRQPILESREALARLDAGNVPTGVVSNASGQIERVLARSVCQVGEGPHPRVRCVVDSTVVGVAKPDPAIFDHALPHFEGIERERIAYVGDSVTMDVGAASAAGLHALLIDPYGMYADPPFETIPSVAALAEELL
jgi:putative hydrolase of the HAD superfamily